MMDENGPKCMKERVLEHSDRSLVAPKDDDRCNNTAGTAGVRAALQSWLRPWQNCLVPLSLSYLSTTSSLDGLGKQRPTVVTSTYLLTTG